MKMTRCLPFLFSAVLVTVSIAARTSRNIGDGASTTPGKTIDIQQVLTWLPTDTEALLVANGPFLMSNFQIERETYGDHEVTSEELEKHFMSFTFRLFFTKNNLLEKYLRGKRVRFGLEASRHFRPPADIGELPFEGCALAVFEDDVDDQRGPFMKEAAQTGVRIEEIEGQKTAVFEERYQQDIWKTFITFPRKNVVFAASNEQFLREMQSRMRSPGTNRGLPNSLPEWKHVNTQAQFWGLRHFDKTQAKDDPTSPFSGKKAANLPDDGAIGLTYECNPIKGHKATLTYLSITEKEIVKIEESRFPSSSEDTAGLHVQRRVLEPGVIQSTYDLSRSRPLSWFFFVFMGSLGHAVYV